MPWTVLACFVAFAVASCTTPHASPELATRRSIELVQERTGTLAWAGIRLGMRPQEVREVLGVHVLRRYDRYVDVCGEYFTDIIVAGRPITIQWSSGGASAEVESIGIPLTESERAMSDIELSQLARATVPAFVDGVAVEYGVAPQQHPMSFVLSGNHDAALLIKSGDSENNLWLTMTACID